MKQPFGPKLLRILLGTAIGLALAETALRVDDYPHPLAYFHQRDNELGESLRPGAHGRFRGEATTYIRVNEEGVRGPEYPFAKQPGTFRIAVLGDSMAAAMSVAESETFASVLERNLSSCGALGGLKPEVIDFGVNGYGTAQELLMLRERVWRYSPDLVILAFTTGNDVRNNLRLLERNPYVPYFVDASGGLVLDDSFRTQPWVRAQSKWWRRAWTWLKDNSRVAELIADVRNEVVGSPASQGNAQAEAGLDNQVYKSPGDAVWQEAWHVTEGIISEMNREVKGHNSEFLLVTVSSGIQVYPDAQMRARFMSRLGVETLFYPDERLLALGRREGFQALNLAPALQEYADAHRVFLHGFAGTRTLGTGHWNVEGNRLAGELIAQKVCGGFRDSMHGGKDQSNGTAQ